MAVFVRTPEGIEVLYSDISINVTIMRFAYHSSLWSLMLWCIKRN